MLWGTSASSQYFTSATPTAEAADFGRPPPSARTTSGVPERSRTSPPSSNLARQFGIEQQRQEEDYDYLPEQDVFPCDEPARALSMPSPHRSSLESRQRATDRNRSVQRIATQAVGMTDVAAADRGGLAPMPPTAKSPQTSRPQPRQRPQPSALDGMETPHGRPQAARATPRTGRSTLGSLLTTGGATPVFEASSLTGALPRRRLSADSDSDAMGSIATQEADAHLPAAYWQPPPSPHITPLLHSPSHHHVPVTALRGPKTAKAAAALASNRIGVWQVHEKRAKQEATNMQRDNVRTVRSIRDRIRDEQRLQDDRLSEIFSPTAEAFGKLSRASISRAVYQRASSKEMPPVGQAWSFQC